MASSIEETLISVLAAGYGRRSQNRLLGTRSFLCGGRAAPDCAKWTFVSRGTNCEGSSRILKRVLAGLNWRSKERRSCSFCSNAAILQLRWTEKCSSTANRRFRKNNGGRKPSDLEVRWSQF